MNLEDDDALCMAILAQERLLEPWESAKLGTVGKERILVYIKEDTKTVWIIQEFLTVPGDTGMTVTTFPLRKLLTPVVQMMLRSIEEMRGINFDNIQAMGWHENNPNRN